MATTARGRRHAPSSAGRRARQGGGAGQRRATANTPRPRPLRAAHPQHPRRPLAAPQPPPAAWGVDYPDLLKRFPLVFRGFGERIHKWLRCSWRGEPIPQRADAAHSGWRAGRGSRKLPTSTPRRDHASRPSRPGGGVPAGRGGDRPAVRRTPPTRPAARPAPWLGRLGWLAPARVPRPVPVATAGTCTRCTRWARSAGSSGPCRRRPWPGWPSTCGCWPAWPSRAWRPSPPRSWPRRPG